MDDDWIEYPAPPWAPYCKLDYKPAVAVFMPGRRPGFFAICEEHLEAIVRNRPDIERREVKW